MPSTAYLLLGPLLLFLPVYLFRRVRRWGALLAAMVLALEAYACLRLPLDGGIIVAGRIVALALPGRMALAWIAGGSALLALAHVFTVADPSPSVFLLPCVSATGLALAVEPFPLALLALWIAMLLAVFLFRAGNAAETRGLSQLLVFTAAASPVFVLADILLSRALAVGPDEIPPWGAIALLVAVGCAALLSLFPFHAWMPGIMGAGQPLAGGWVAGIAQPLLLFVLARVMQTHPDIPAALPLQKIALVAALGSAVAGAVFAAFAQRPGRMLGYTVLTGLAPLFLLVCASGGRVTSTYWMGVLAYSAALILACIGLAGVERAGKPLTLAGWAAEAKGRGAAVALLLAAAFSLCGLPVGIGFWVHNAAREGLTAAPAVALTILQAAPLVAAIGWWRVLRVSLQQREEDEQPAISRAARACFWGLALLLAAVFIWPASLASLAAAFARALGSL